MFHLYDIFVLLVIIMRKMFIFVMFTLVILCGCESKKQLNASTTENITTKEKTEEVPTTNIADELTTETTTNKVPESTTKSKDKITNNKTTAKKETTTKKKEDNTKKTTTKKKLLQRKLTLAKRILMVDHIIMKEIYQNAQIMIQV